jgi:hypothetical protein
MLAESVQDSKNGREFTGGGRQCWGLVLKCFGLKEREYRRDTKAKGPVRVNSTGILFIYLYARVAAHAKLH